MTIGDQAFQLLDLPGDAPAVEDPELEALEIELLLEAIYRHYGLDYREYARSSLRRRLWRRARAEGLATLSGLQERILHDPACLERLQRDLSINVTSMFRDPTFYQALRAKVVPRLRTYPFLRIWAAGCSTGEEVYSLAILLHEEGLAERTRIYATDINESVVERARTGAVPLDRLRGYARDYERAGGTATFADYFTIGEEHALLRPELLEGVLFAQHDLVSDRSFNEFHVIMCRNVMIYFGRSLQDEVHDLFYESLVTFGILALGRKESIRFTRHENHYEALDAREKLYRKLPG